VCPILFGMAGPAEAALAAAFGMIWFCLFLAMLCAGLALLIRSRLAAISGIFLLVLTAYVFQPWKLMGPIPPSNDPDARYFLSAFHNLAIQWILVAVATFGGALRAFWFRRHEKG
jgi:hypothetical protein